MTFIQGKFLRGSDLEVGSVYVFRDGRVCLFLGKTSSEEPIFYLVSAVIFVNGEHIGELVILDEDIEVRHLKEILSEKLELPVNKSAIQVFDTLPAIYGSIFRADATDHLMGWLMNNNIVGIQQEELPKMEILDSAIVPVKPRELIVGKVYVTCKSDVGASHEGQTSTYIYLGKSREDGESLWGYVGSLPDWKNIGDANTIVRKYLSNKSNISSSKSQKKVYVPRYYAWINTFNFSKIVKELI